MDLVLAQDQAQVGGQCLTHWMAGGLKRGAGHSHLGQGRQIEQFVQH